MKPEANEANLKPISQPEANPEASCRQSKVRGDNQIGRTMVRFWALDAIFNPIFGL
jgi:hypothetical protein